MEFNSREELQIPKLLEKLKEVDEEEKGNENQKDMQSRLIEILKFLDPIKKMIECGLNVEVICFIRSNIYGHSKECEKLEEYLKKSITDVKYKIAHSIIDLWFQLWRNVENLDIIHIFSSESDRAPEAANRFLEDRKSEDLLKFHGTGSSFEEYFNKVGTILNKQIKELENNEEFLWPLIIDFNSESFQEENRYR